MMKTIKGQKPISLWPMILVNAAAILASAIPALLIR